MHWLRGDIGVEEPKPVENDYLQRWAVQTSEPDGALVLLEHDRVGLNRLGIPKSASF
jgi:hypothetical protein